MLLSLIARSRVSIFETWSLPSRRQLRTLPRSRPRPVSVQTPPPQHPPSQNVEFIDDAQSSQTSISSTRIKSKTSSPPSPAVRTVVSHPGAQPKARSTMNEPSPRNHMNFTSHHVSRHWETIPPTTQQLKAANKYFQAAPPRFLWSSPKFATMNFGDSPEVCFLGRSNVGKSSLLNSILGRNMAHVSAKPGRTKMMNAFAVDGNLELTNENRLVVLDMPGYGHGGRADWGKEILKYLSQRKQIKRAFVLVNAEHGIKKSDEQLLALFRKHNISHQVVLSKVDEVLFHGRKSSPSVVDLNKRFEALYKLMDEVKSKVSADLEDEGSGLGEVIACSSMNHPLLRDRLIGVDAIRFAMLRAAGLEQQPVEEAPAIDIVPHEEIENMTPVPTGRAASAAPVEPTSAKTERKKRSLNDDVVSWADLNL